MTRYIEQPRQQGRTATEDFVNDTMYPHVVRYVRDTPWAVQPQVLATITELLAFRAGGGRLTRTEIEARLGVSAAAPGNGGQVGRASAGAVAVIPLHGVVVPRAGMFDDVSGLTSLDRFGARFREAMNDERVGSILLHIDSPGGVVDGVPEMAAEIMDARGVKPVVAIADAMAASAAYWIAVAADELVVTPSGEVGSIGVFSSHVDWSGFEEMQGIKTTLIAAGKYKVEANPFEPLSDDARAAIQARVDDYYGMFVKGVATARGRKASEVRGGFGEGRVVGARDAVAMGMADRVADFRQTVTAMASGRRQTRRRAASRRFAFS